MKKFLQQVLASLIGSFTGLVLFLILTGGGFFILLVALLVSNSAPRIENQSVLVFNLNNQITDYQTRSELSLLVNEQEKQLTLHELTRAINQAAQDNRISAILLDGSRGNVLTGYASLTEIRNALDNFRQSGKKIIAYNVVAGEKDYFLTSIADEVSLNPMGIMELNGLASSQLFFANAFEKYGIGVQVIRVGKYKSAIEPFTLSDYSPESELQTQELLDDLWTSFLENVSKNRDLQAGELDNIANNKGIVEGKSAQDLSLVDHLKYQDEVVDSLKKVSNSTNKESFPQVSLKAYLNANPPAQVHQNNQIAVLYVEGAIVDGEGQIGQVGGNRYIREIKKIREDKKIKGVVVRINSPGGSAVASELIFRELQLTAKQKPVIVSMGDVAASGGYWIATAGEQIFANASTVTGSIGVFGLLFNLEDIAQDNGINNAVVKTNKFADLSNTFKAKSPEELAIFQENVERIYNIFLNKVAEARKLPVNQVAQIAQGRVWSGRKARQIGLVDQIGGLNEAIAYLNEQLELNNKYQITNFPPQRTWETELLNKLSESKVDLNSLSKETLAKMIWQQHSELELKQILQNPYQIYSILPYKLNIK